MEVTHAEQSAIMTSLPPAERAALALNSSQTERDLRELAVKHTSIQAIKDKAGRDQAHGAAMEVKRARTTIERIAKEARDDATKFSKAVIAEQNRLVSIIEPEEQRLLALRDAWDAEQEKIREAAAAAERFRVEQIMGRIEAIRGFQRMAMDCRTSAAVQRLQEGLAKVDLTGMDEFDAQAMQALAETADALDKIREQLEADEAERARIKAEQEAEADRLAAERAAFEAEQAEFRRRQSELMQAEEAKRVELAAKAMAAQAEAEQAAKRVLLIDEDGEVPLIADLSATPEFIAPAPVQEAVQAPEAIDLILAIAEQFGADQATARDWLIRRATEIESAEI